MEDIAAFIGFLLLTGSLFLLAKFVLEQEEFRYVRNMSPFFAILAAVLFWGAGRLEPTLSAADGFFVSGCLTLALIFAAQAFQPKKKRPLVALVLALIAAALAIPLTLLALWFLFSWFPSTFFTPPPTEHQYESRLSEPQPHLAPARSAESAQSGIRLVASLGRESRELALSAAKICRPDRNLAGCAAFALALLPFRAEKAQARACSRQIPALDHRA